jgi:hypothetical protein
MEVVEWYACVIWLNQLIARVDKAFTYKQKAGYLSNVQNR